MVMNVVHHERDLRITCSPSDFSDLRYLAGLFSLAFSGYSLISPIDISYKKTG